MSTLIIASTIFFILGLIVGSFLNVVICRLNTAKTLGGRSACMSCCHTLCWYELVPLVSFLGLGGRCRHCQSRISIQYPLVELFTGLIFVVLFLRIVDLGVQGFDFLYDLKFLIAYVYYATMFSILIVVAVYDYRHKIIPDVLSFSFGLLGFVGLFLFAHFGFMPHVPDLIDFMAGPIISLPFALLWLVSGGAWMGLGDAKLALGIGWLLGLSLAFSAMAIAFWVGAIAGLGLVVASSLLRGASQYGMKSEMPFALYLALGTLCAFVFRLSFFVL